MDINRAYIFVQFCANKSQNGNITPDQFNALAPVMQISVISDLIGNEKEYKPHDPTPRYGYNINDKVRADLLEIMVSPTTTAVAAGIAPYPADLLYLDTSITTTNGVIMHEVTSDEVAILNNSQIKPPTVQYPFYVTYSDGIYVYPSSIASIKLSYVRKPIDPKWNYTIVNEVPVYSASGSQDFELNEMVHLRICSKILAAVGVNLSMADLTAYAVAMEASGQ